jgi:translation initiation factor 2B subunit (eIF-2B alpha/beta/delta family)
MSVAAKAVEHETVMDSKLISSIARLRADHSSGASDMVVAAAEILGLARRQGAEVLHEAAVAIREAQPAMASLRNLAAAAIRDNTEPGALDLFSRKQKDAAERLPRFAAGVIRASHPGRLRVVTHSFSGTVLRCVQTLLERGLVHVACSEGRPALEGRRMADALAAAGAKVDFFTDAGLSTSLAEADALLLGADAVTRRWFLNKCGTAALASWAARCSIPTYVLAASDKILPEKEVASLRVEDQDPAEVWDTAPAGVTVKNRYFELVPLDLAHALVTESAVTIGREPGELWPST